MKLQEYISRIEKESEHLAELSTKTYKRVAHFADKASKKADTDAERALDFDDAAGAEEMFSKRDKHEKSRDLAKKQIVKSKKPSGAIIRAKAPELVKDSVDLTRLLKLSGL